MRDFGSESVEIGLGHTVGSKIEVLDSRGGVQKYRLLGIVSDEIRDEEKVTKIWNSQTDKSGKATLRDRILIMCPEGSKPKSFSSNDEIVWNPTESGPEV